MKEPPSIEPAPRPTTDYDPLDLIVEDLQYVESFLDFIAQEPNKREYLKKHISSILALRRTFSHQIELLSNDPYFYNESRLKKLHKDNEDMYLFIEDVIGSADPLNQKQLTRALKAGGKALSQFENDLTP